MPGIASAGTLERVSVGSDGNQGNWPVVSPFIFEPPPLLSANGRVAVFASGSPTLVPGDTNGASDVFVRDRVARTTERVSLDSAGNQGNSYSSSVPAISADGRFVAFVSSATNLVPGDTNGVVDVFVHGRRSPDAGP